MAKVINGLNLAERKPSARYPWVEWLDGQGRELTRGVDFQVTPANFRTTFYQECKRRALQGLTQTISETVLRIQAVPRK